MSNHSGNVVRNRTTIIAAPMLIRKRVGIYAASTDCPNSTWYLRRFVSPSGSKSRTNMPARKTPRLCTIVKITISRPDIDNTGQTYFRYGAGCLSRGKPLSRTVVSGLRTTPQYSSVHHSQDSTSDHCLLRTGGSAPNYSVAIRYFLFF